MTKILIVEDDLEIAMLEEDYLNINGYETETIHDGAQALEKIKEQDYALIILDSMLPNVSGLELCRKIREEKDVPIIMVTAKNNSTDIVRALGLGADDYITKPFDPAELVARVSRHINRYDYFANKQPTAHKEQEIILGDITIVPNNWQIFRKGEEIKLPNREFQLLVFLAENPNIVFTKEDLYEKIWGNDYLGDSATVMVHVNRLREKLEQDSKNPKIIETIWGAGYRLNK